MSEKRQYTDGKNQFLISDAEAAELNRGRPSYLAPILPVDDKAKIRVNYENQEGEIVDELVPATAVRNRATLGENIVATPESIEVARKDQQARDVQAMADEEDFTTLVNAAVPGMQLVQNAIVGEEEAAKARGELGTNVAANLVGNLAEFALGGVALGAVGKVALGAERARKIGVITGLNEASGTGLGLIAKKTGQIAAADALIESHMYVQNQLDTNGPFVAEDWARQVATGMLLSGPFIASGAARGAARAVGKAVGPSALGTARTAMTTLAVVSSKGAEAAKYARGAAATGLVGKLLHKVRRKGVAQTDEVATAARQVEADMYRAQTQITPGKLDGMTPTKRAAAVEEYRRYGMEPNLLDDIDWDNMAPSIKKMGQAVNKVRTEAIKMHRKLLGDGVADIKLTNKARDAMIAQANGLLRHAESAGMADVKNALKRGIIDAGDDVPSMHKALIEAKVNARFRRGVDGGADIVDDQLTAFLRDESIFGKRGVSKNNEIMGAVDDVVQVWDDLGDIRVPGRAKDYESITTADGVGLGKNSDAIARMRSAVDTLTENNLLSVNQRAAFETAMVEASDAIRRGTGGYRDAIKVNRARNTTLGKLKKERDLAGKVVDSPESFAAARAESAMDTAQEIGKMTVSVLDALTSTRPMQAAAGITSAIHGLDKNEKRQTFELIHQELVKLAGNPHAMIENMEKYIDTGARYNPPAADHAAQKATNTIFYLQSQLPPVDDTIYGRGSPQPLSAIEEFMEKFLAAADPVAVGYEVASATITPEMVNSLRATNPEVYAQMQVEVANALSKVPAEKANPQVVAAASTFMGGLDPLYTGDFIAKIQSNYAQTSAQDQVINGGQRRANNPGAEQGLTTAQRQATY